MRKSIKSTVLVPYEGESRCLLDMNRCDSLRTEGIVPDLRHTRSAHMSAAWKFAGGQIARIELNNADLSQDGYLTFSAYSTRGAGGSFCLRLLCGAWGRESGGYETVLSITHDGWNDYRVHLPSMAAFGEGYDKSMISAVAFDCTRDGQSNRPETVLYIDSMHLWDVAPPLYAKMPELKGAAVFSKAGSYAIVDRKKLPIAIDGSAVRPFEEKGVLWLPMAPVAGIVAHSAVADNVEGTLSFSYRRKKYKFSHAASYTLDGETVQLGFTPALREGVLFFPADYVREFFRWRQIYTDPMGLVILSNRKHIFESPRCDSTVSMLVADTAFSRPDADMVLADLHRRFPNPTRGRLLLSFDDLQRLRRAVKSDVQLSYLASLLEAEYGKGSAAFAEEPCVAEEAASLEEAARRLWGESMLYRMTGNKEYCQKAYALALALCDLESWNSAGALTFGEVTLSMAIAYDWCHHMWSEGEKARIERGMLRLGLRVGNSYFAGRSRTRHPGSAAAGAIGAGMLALSLCLANVYPETAKAGITGAMTVLEPCYMAFAPDGGDASGIRSWEKRARATLLAVAMLEKACGTDYGFSAYPGWKNAAYFPIYTDTPTGAWNYHDTPLLPTDTSSLPFFTLLTGDPVPAWLRRQQLRSGKRSIDPLDILFFSPVDDSLTPRLPLDALRRSAGIALMRSGWQNHANVLGLHGGKNTLPGGNLDGGNVLLEMGGVRFLGLPAHREDPILGRRAEGQNTLYIATDRATPDQDPGANVPFLEMRSDAGRAYAIVDMTSTNHAFLKARRGVMLTEKRSIAVIQDEVTLASPAPVTWSAWTQAEVKMPKSGRRVNLTLEGKTLQLRLGGVGAPARFSVEQVGDWSHLTVTVEGKEKLRIFVAAVLLDKENPAPQKLYDLTALSRWGEEA